MGEVEEEERGSVGKCPPAELRPMRVFVKALLLFRSSIERQNALEGPARGMRRENEWEQTSVMHLSKTQLSKPLTLKSCNY